MKQLKNRFKDGMTISFHHHFREGDYVMNLVLAEIAAMGLKNISIALVQLQMFMNL